MLTLTLYRPDGSVTKKIPLKTADINVAAESIATLMEGKSTYTINGNTAEFRCGGMVNARIE